MQNIDILFKMNTKITSATSVNPLSQTLSFYRKRAGLTQEEVSRMLHVTRQAYANYEKGLREPSLSTLVQMAHILNVTADALLNPHSQL